MLELEIDQREFDAFRELIYRESGIKLSDLKKALVQARISRRCRNLHIETFRDYYNYLVDNYDHEKIEFINSITTNKTEFFRENQHFKYMNEVVLPEFEKSKRKKLRIWSAGCSTGEEPYTISLTVHEYFKNRKMPDFKILATDIDTRVLETAVQGVYKHDEVADIELPLLQKYFFRGTGDNAGLFKVKDVLKKTISFRRLNLMDEKYPMRGQFDLVFCRNVIIYFDKKDQVVLFQKIHRHMYPGSYLFIGHSENISNITADFKLVGNTMYQRIKG